jgi:hypothetical protein
LDDLKQQEIRALGRLGWTLSRIQEATGVRRGTISGYLKAAGTPVRGRGRPSESKLKPAISSEVSPDPGPSNRAISGAVSADVGRAAGARESRPSCAPSSWRSKTLALAKRPGSGR